MVRETGKLTNLPISLLDNIEELIIAVDHSGNVIYKNKFAKKTLPNVHIIKDDYVSLKPSNTDVAIAEWTSFPYANDLTLLHAKIVTHEPYQNILQKVIDEIPIAIFWKDLDKVIIGCNRLYARNAGYNDPQELIGKTDYDFPWRDFAEKYIQDDMEIINKKTEKISYEEINRRYDGSIRTVLVSKVPLYDDAREIIGVLGIYSDITERKLAMEREKQATVEMVKAEQARSDAEKTSRHMRDLAATIAHELRTPLGTISNSAKLLGLVTQNLSDQAVQSKLQKIQELITIETNKTNGFINIIMESLSDLERIAISKISIKDCVIDAIERFPYEYDEKNLIHYEDLKDFSLRGDQEILVHILFNLIKNALHFIEAAGKGDVTIWTEMSDEYNYLHFKDTGKGMSQDKAEQIFDKFYTDTGIGTGVGLYFCKNAMNIMGGDIACEAKEGEYAHFTLSFTKISDQDI